MARSTRTARARGTAASVRTARPTRAALDTLAQQHEEVCVLVADLDVHDAAAAPAATARAASTRAAVTAAATVTAARVPRRVVSRAASRTIAAVAPTPARTTRAAARDEIDEAVLADLSPARDALAAAIRGSSRPLHVDGARAVVAERDLDLSCRRARLARRRVPAVSAIRARRPCAVGAAVSVSTLGACGAARVESEQHVTSDLLASISAGLSVHEASVHGGIHDEARHTRRVMTASSLRRGTRAALWLGWPGDEREA